MTAWFAIINEFKRRPVESLLTKKQQIIHDHVANLLQYPEWINVFGVQGVGKTFLAWALARTTGAIHVSSIRQLKELDVRNIPLLVDNAPSKEREVRRVLANANLLNAPNVVLLSRMPIEMRIHSFELDLPNELEIQQAMQTIQRFGFYTSDSIPENPTFWDLLQIYT